MRDIPIGAGVRPRRRNHPPRDYVVLIYSGANLEPMDRDHPDSKAGSSRLLPDLRKLAPRTREASVAFVAQGYERLPSGTWRTSRVVIEGGRVEDRTEEIRGARRVYDASGACVGRATSSGEETGLFEKETFLDFLVSSMERFPARRAVLIFGSHGLGFEGVAGESVRGGVLDRGQTERLPLNDLVAALIEARAQTGKKLGMVDFNSCVMGEYEVLDQVRKAVPLVVASPEAQLAEWPFPQADIQAIIPSCLALLENPRMTPEEFGKTLLEQSAEGSRFSAEGEMVHGVPTLALYDSRKIPVFKPLLDRLGRGLVRGLEEPDLKPKILEAISRTFAYSSSHLKDLKSFLANLKQREVLQRCGLEDTASALESSFPQATCVMFRGFSHEKSYAEVGPFSVFLPGAPTAWGVELALRQYIPSPGGDLGKEVADLKKALVDPFWKDPAYIRSLEAIREDVVEAYPRMLSAIEDSQGLGAVLTENDGSFQALFQMAEEGKQDGWRLAPEAKTRALAILTELDERFKPFDFQRILDTYDETESEKLRNRAKEAFSKAYVGRLDRQASRYEEMDGIPPGWRRFIRRLLEIHKQETLPRALAESDACQPPHLRSHR